MPLAHYEQEFATACQGTGGVEVFAPVGGARPGAARAEIIAGILALAGPGAVHIGTDHMNLLRKHDAICRE
eukprot:2655834-Alexandrium_andersonii.AAC.1